jgi:hypothetical protein
MATKIDLNKVPRFAELPIKPDKPNRHGAFLATMTNSDA